MLIKTVLPHCQPACSQLASSWTAICWSVLHGEQTQVLISTPAPHCAWLVPVRACVRLDACLEPSAVTVLCRALPPACTLIGAAASSNCEQGVGAAVIDSQHVSVQTVLSTGRLLKTARAGLWLSPASPHAGWQFGPDGQAVVIPQIGSIDKKAEQVACANQRACATSFPCQVCTIAWVQVSAQLLCQLCAVAYAPGQHTESHQGRASLSTVILTCKGFSW